MRFICSQSDLRQKLSCVNRAVPPKPSHPILSNIFVVASQETGVVSLQGFDLSLGIEVSLQAYVSESGSALIPAKKFLDIVSLLPDGEVTFSFEEDNSTEDIRGKATVSSACGVYEFLSTESRDDYPPLPMPEDCDRRIELTAEVLSEGLRSTLFAVAPPTGGTASSLTGVSLKFSPGEVEFAGTDGHRLSLLRSGSLKVDEDIDELSEVQIVIPAKVLREIEHLIGDYNKEEIVMLSVDSSQVAFRVGSDKIVGRKLLDQFPSYQDFLPTQFVERVVVDRREFQDALSRVAVLSAIGKKSIYLELDPENSAVHLTVGVQDVGTAHESVAAKMIGEQPFKIVFSDRYLEQGVKSFPDRDIQFSINGTESPVVIEPAGGGKTKYLLMPKRSGEG